MSMPSYWFDPMVNTGPLGGLGGNAATGQPAMSADQINASMGMGPGGAGAQNQAVLNNNFNNFGTLTDYYSSLGASYGRATGGFGGAPGRVGTIGNPGTSNPGYLSSAQYDPFTAGAPPVQHYGGYGGNQVFDPQRYLQQNPDVWKSGALPWEHYNQFGRNEGRQAPWSDVFNSTGYAQANPDVAASGMDPTAHWFNFGQKEGRGGQTFNPTQYLSQNRDVWEAGADPWQHYSQFGEKEGRQGAWSEAFNPTSYAQHNPDVAAAGVDPTAHWFNFGQNEGRQGATGGDPFNVQEYLLQNRDVAAAGMDPLQHWMNFGYKEGRDVAFGGTEDADWDKYFSTATAGGGGANTGKDAAAAEYFMANPDVFAAAQASGRDPTAFGFEHLMNFGMDEDRSFFDRFHYNQDNPDVAASGMDPTAHYFQFGQKEGRAAPTAHFNYGEYLAQNPDVLSAGMDPMAHWLQFGANEKRQGALGNLTNTLVDQRKGFAELARSDPNLMFKLVAKAMQEDQNSSEGRTAVIEAMLNRLNATGQNPLNPAYYPKDKAVYNAGIENRLRNDSALYARVLQDVERAFGGSNIAKYGTNWSSGDTWKYEKQFVNPTQEMGANNFYIKNLNTAAGKAWAGPGIVKDNQRWLDRVMGNTVTGN